jgi:retinol dehydrogenase 12
MALHPSVIVVGATGAIGSALAATLARQGVQVTLMARPSVRLSSLAKRLGGAEKRISSLPVDMASMDSVRAAAGAINDSGGHVDALVHTAAIFVPEYRKSPDGLELMLATNHLGPFLMTNLLRDRLAGGGRVITVTAPSTTRIDMARLLDRKRFRAPYNFGASRAANLLFTLELARRGKRWDVRANAFHPGLVRSELMREASLAVRLASRLAAVPALHAAQDLTELALSPAFAGTTGWFFKGARRIDPPKQVVDLGAQANLWQRSAELVELDQPGF